MLPLLLAIGLLPAAETPQDVPPTEAAAAVPDSSVPPVQAQPQGQAPVFTKATVVRGKSRARRLKESGYAVDVVQVGAAKAGSGDVQDLVARQSGVVVREEGGLGSGAKLSLNGLSGKHVRIFLDGVPIEQLGTGLELGDLPPNAVQSIEVYKGVVPVHLGADALGGALDVRTVPDPRPFLDASWSWGSYGTHRGALAGLWRADSLPLAVRLNAYVNRSDNDYPIRWKLTDPQTGKYGAEQDFRRFHDGYSSAWGNGEVGLVGTRWADQLWLGVAAGRSDKEIQHGNSLDRVYGEVGRKASSLQGSLRWEKRDLWLEGLSGRAWLSAGGSSTDLVDTSSLQYDWTGEGKVRNTGNGNGEALWYKTLYAWEERTRTAFADLRWSRGDDHLEASLTLTGYESELEDRRNATTYPPSGIDKQVAGLSYRRDLFAGRLSATLFGKSYRQTATLVDMSSYANESEGTVEKSVSETGFGGVLSFQPLEGVVLKASFEDALRLQDASELLGDGLLLKSNVDLRPERSRNLNVGALAEAGGGGQRLRAEVGGFLRDLDDKIRLNGEGATSRYENVGKVRVAGVEGDLGWTGWERLEAGINATWQDPRDRTPGSVTHGAQLPNTPLVYGNARMGLRWERPRGLDLSLRLDWDLHHVREYFLYWPIYGDAQTKHRIPEQWTQSAGATAVFLDGRLSWALECRNLTDALTYDDWRKQKPGRTWATKLRVSL